MATALPLATAFTDPATTEGQEKTAITNLRAALAEIGDPTARPGAIQNLSLAFTVASSALTCNVRTGAGATAAAADPISCAMRNVTLATGDFNIRNITGAVSLVSSSGSTLGHSNAVAGNIYWYLIDNAGALELAASTAFFGQQGIVTTVAEGGAGAADSATVMYSTTARTNVPFRCIGHTIDTQTTAGTWAAVPSTVEIAPFDLYDSTGAPLMPIGASSGTAVLIGKAVINMGNVGNVGAGPDDLMSYTLPANSLSANGKGVRVTAWGRTGNNANAKQLSAFFGAFNLAQTGLTVSIQGTWKAEILVARIGANSQEYFYELREAADASPVAAGKQRITVTGNPTETDTAPITIKFSASVVTADNDIVQEGMLVEFLG